MQNSMEQGRNRVFVNPNFNKGANSATQRPVMHVNPNFSHNNPLQKGPPLYKGKIYINPKFVSSNRHNNQVPVVNTHYESRQPYELLHNNTFRNNGSSIPTQASVSCSTIPAKSSLIQPILTNSRYSLVRSTKPELPQTVSTNTTVTSSQTNMVKINKYKSIRITDMKKKIDSVKLIVQNIPSKISGHSSTTMRYNSKNAHFTPPKTHANRYKLVRPTHSVVNKTPLRKLVTVNTRKIVTTRTRIKTVGVYKKNNIPCPQYRKYGKCLRKSQGKCEFLHDKKHVSICRKFLTGVCHDEKCLLSHELSDKKMPTCYFYLKGMCTKEECPYLHVKLNEKAKICSDFIKGYCEKGDQCLNRHIASSSFTLKRRDSLRKLTPQKSGKSTNEKIQYKKNIESVQKRRRKIKLHKQSSIEENKDSSVSSGSGSGRYYKDNKVEQDCSESTETIKPSRCKLGTLPSFIQL